jgi:hypothetical protein
LVLRTSVQVRPPPETPATVVFVPETKSAATNASSSWLPDVVEKGDVVTVRLACA